MTTFLSRETVPFDDDPPLDGFAPRPFDASVVSTVGNTPLVALDRMFAKSHFRVFGKAEWFNPGGSIKDRTARSIIEQALRTGQLTAGASTVVESTSGNLGIALAQLCNFHRLGLVVVIDPRTTQQNAAIMRAYGAHVELVEKPDPKTGEFLPSRLARVKDLLADIPGSYWPNQYGNEANPLAHRRTMQEIHEAVPGKLDYLFSAAGTTGTLRGCAEYIQERGLDVTVVAVDAIGSAIFGPPEPWEKLHRRRIPGHGAALVPPLLRPGLADKLIKVADSEAVAACRDLLASESLLAGGSSGAALAAVWRAASWIEPGAQVAVILPDGGDRYLDTIYSDKWVAEQIGGRFHPTGERVA